MSHAWFIYSNEVVSGPFGTPVVQAKLAKGEIPLSSFIWWKGQNEWIAINQWTKDLPSIVEASVGRTQKPIWYVNSSGESQIGPLTQNELINNLKSLSDLSGVNLWAVGMSNWVNLFELGDIMELLGISRRENERAPLMGVVAVTRSNDDPRGFVLKATSLSLGGMGMTGKHDLRRGDQVALLVKSPELPGPIHLRGEVAYVTDTNFVGVRFVKVHPETQSLILDYIKVFNGPAAEDIKGAA
jgi:hypothetical protein